ncbi:MAG: hypothetical protein ACPGWR_24520 [Ardenticatenaceae bacterium]
MTNFDFERVATIFERMDAGPALAHVGRLDEAWSRLLRGERAPAPLLSVRHAGLPATDGEFDVVYAGGGLSVLHALAMQRRGWRVLLFDRRAVGQTHREWNISRAEMALLVEGGLFSWQELAGVMAREYERGFIRFHDPSGAPVEFDLPGVLDVAIDASALLSLARRKLEAAGGTVWEGCAFEYAWLASDGLPRAVVGVRKARQEALRVGAKLLVNGMGALSPLSLALAGEGLPLDGVCPTVGTVARGFAEGEIDPQVGEILVTLEGAREGRQLIWEGFPTHGDHFTTYLFYYDVTQGRAEDPHSLLTLFDDYFHLLPRYKRLGPNFAHLKPVYGFIPARHHLDGSPSEQARCARALLSIGDAAARQNPLTFTGFGSFVRHLPATTARLDECLHTNELQADTLATLSAAQSNLNAMWVLSRFLAPRHHPDDVNSIFRDFTQALAQVGPQRAADFFLDRASWRDYIEIMLRTARQRPQVFIEAYQVLGGRGVAQWLEDLAKWKWSET